MLAFTDEADGISVATSALEDGDLVDVNVVNGWCSTVAETVLLDDLLPLSLRQAALLQVSSDAAIFPSTHKTYPVEGRTTLLTLEC